MGAVWTSCRRRAACRFAATGRASAEKAGRVLPGALSTWASRRDSPWGVDRLLVERHVDRLADGELVSGPQLRVGLQVPEAVRHRICRPRHSAADPDGELGLLRAGVTA